MEEEKEVGILVTHISNAQGNRDINGNENENCSTVEIIKYYLSQYNLFKSKSKALFTSTVGLDGLLFGGNWGCARVDRWVWRGLRVVLYTFIPAIVCILKEDKSQAPKSEGKRVTQIWLTNSRK